MGTRGEKVWELPGYVLLERIALGGRGEVYLAREGGDAGPLVAVKVLRPEDASRADRVEAFIDEVAISTQLIHPNIVRVYHGDVHDGLPYLVMEHVDGLTLWDVNERARMIDKRVPLELCASMVAKVADALSYAHELRDHQGQPMNLVHRDVSAVNVMATFDGAIKLIDFGIARFTLRNQQTAPGIIKGKLDYLSPEQCTGGTIDALTDIYSLGVLLFELITGTRPYYETDIATLFRKVSQGMRPRVSDLRTDVPRQLEAIVDRAMATKPHHRYPSARAMLDDLEAFIQTLPARPTSTTLSMLMIELAPDKVREISDTYGPPETTAISPTELPDAQGYGAPPFDDGHLFEQAPMLEYDASAGYQTFAEDDEATQIDPNSGAQARSRLLTEADTVVEDSPLEGMLDSGPPEPKRNRTALIILAIIALFSLATLLGILVTLALRSRSPDPAPPTQPQSHYELIESDHLFG